MRVTVERSKILYDISSIIGWIYFFAWSISFYPQLWSNYKRQSVVGLNFDYLSLNILGFILYSLFNCGLYWIPEIEVCLKKQKKKKYINTFLLSKLIFIFSKSISVCIQKDWIPFNQMIYFFLFMQFLQLLFQYFSALFMR